MKNYNIILLSFYDVNANADLDLDPKIQMGILIH